MLDDVAHHLKTPCD